MSATVTRVDPLSVGDEIKALFLANERPEFPAWFDRAYPTVVRLGTTSWVTREGGRVTAHIAAMPMRLVHEGREIAGWLLSNLMSDRDHRDFFGNAALARRAVADLRDDGAAFVVTNPINRGAEAILRGAGLERLGSHDRFVLPTGDPRPPVDLLCALHLRARRWTTMPLRVEQVSAPEAAATSLELHASFSRLTTRRLDTLYAMREQDFGGARDHGYLAYDRGGVAVGVALVRVEGPRHAHVVTIRATGSREAGAFAAAVGRAARADGIHRLAASAVLGSPFARALRQGGFVARNEPWMIVGRGFTDAGRAALQAVEASDLEHVDLD